MTTANLMNVPSVNGNYSAQIENSKKLQDESVEVAAVFAGLVNQTPDFSNQMVDETSSNMDVKTDSTQSAANSYERYSYRENKIDEAKPQDVSEKLEESMETLEQTEQEIVDVISEEYGVSEEEIYKLLDDMGLSVLDLLNPQNLVGFMMQLTGVASSEELLLDESFLSVMEMLDTTAEGLMKELNVDMEGLQDLISQMDVVDAETKLPDSFQKTLDTVLENSKVDDTIPQTEENAQTADVMKQTADANVQVATDANTQADANAQVNAENATEVEVNLEQKNQNMDERVEGFEVEDATVVPKGKGDTSFAEQQPNDNSLLNHQSNTSDAFVTQQSNAMLNQVTEMSQTQFSSYLSSDTIQIVEQIVQQMRVTISAEMTSMEMQLNPENLGKVYVNISSEEGVVNAQFHATNEVVKEALEAQIATLRENLNQAGVKVDAIEVTIESHEFERNLEQNQQNPEENKEVQESNVNKRRNISLDSLDELSGVMTEEETLVAQIMKDNGNSVDFTA